jgi:hypothetical protein
MFALLVLVVLGIWSLLRTRATRLTGYALMVLIVCTTIFATGTSDSIFASFNTWLFDHLLIWRGFRDAEKWVAPLAAVYAVCAALGAGVIANAWPRLKKGIMVLVCVIPLMFTSAMLFGFNGQVRPVWYPQEWYAANDILKKDSHCRAVFLPWHEYYNLSFNDSRTTANTAAAFFNCDIIEASSPDVGPLRGETNPDQSALTNLMLGTSTSDTQKLIDELKKRGVTHIVRTHSLSAIDPYSYSFLDNEGFILSYPQSKIDDSIEVYEIQ